MTHTENIDNDSFRRAISLSLETNELNSKLQDATDTINDIFCKYNITERISPDDIEFSNTFLSNRNYSEWNPESKTDFFFRKEKLSRIFFDHYYPQPANTTFYHFTTFDNFESIIKNQEVWLYNLIKRFKHEFQFFYADHGLTNDEALPKSIMKDIYYISFARSATIPVEDEENLWRTYGEDGFGVRIEFEITPISTFPDFRNVYYQSNTTQKNQLLFNEIVDAIKTKYSRIFTIRGISKIGGFYLNGDFDTEHESRLLIKNHTDDYAFRFKPFTHAGDIKYIKLKFDNPYATITIKSIQPGSHLSDVKVKEVLDLYPLPIKPSILLQ